ncbi:MAG: hypothetical protein U5Q44_09325 [Dehalococcoidia bacterium]|nr:hypothetical protein [Dehalococcoidia bacterium]
MKIYKEELGGAHAQQGVGVADNAVDSDEEAIAAIKQYLRFMPPNCWQLPHAARPAMRWIRRSPPS